MLDIGALETNSGASALHDGSRMKRVRWVFASVVLLALAIAGYFAWRWATAATSAVEVTTIRPVRKSIASTVTTSGTVRLMSGAKVRVGSQVSGIVRRLNVTVGSRIEQGQVIAEIDPTQLQARVDQARAQVEVNRVAVAKAERDVARVKSIVGMGISRQQFDDLNWQLEAAKSQLAKSETDLKAALEDLSYTTIRAPISGVVSSVTTQQGETVAASFAAPTFVTIVKDQALELLAMVDETDIGGIKPGDRVDFTVEAYPAAEFAATVERIDPTATIVSGVVNYPVIARIAGKVELLKPDMTANVVIQTGQRSVVEIPTVAIQRSGGQRYVYVREGRTLLRKTISVGIKDGENSEVAGGLSGNEEVVTSGFPAASADSSAQ